METLTLSDEIKTFGMQVTTFPNGVGEAFGQLAAMLPDGHARPYYGISQCINETILYHAATNENFEGEGAKYGLENYLVEKGEYLVTTVSGWRQKIHCIKDVFAEMFKDERADLAKPCIEVYKSDEEMDCLVKTKG